MFAPPSLIRSPGSATAITRYRDICSFAERQEEAKRILEKYPTRVPIICEPHSTMEPPIDKIKYLVPTDLTIGQFMFVLRKRVRLAPEHALFVRVGERFPSMQESIGDLYDASHESCGFLFMCYSIENTFGGALRPPC